MLNVPSTKLREAQENFWLYGMGLEKKIFFFEYCYIPKLLYTKTIIYQDIQPKKIFKNLIIWPFLGLFIYWYITVLGYKSFFTVRFPHRNGKKK